MDEEELRERIEDWEDFRTEFMENITRRSSEELARCMVGFANSEGGDIIVGISSKKEIKGVSDVNSALRLIEETASRKCEPPVAIYPKTIFYEGKPIIVISVAKGLRKPYKTIKGTYYLRTGSKIKPASRDELLTLLQIPRSHYFNENPVYNSTADDLEREEFSRFLRQYIVGDKAGGGEAGEHEKGIPEEVFNHYLNALRIMDGKTLTVAGTLFFAKNPQKFIPYSLVSIYKYMGNHHTSSYEWSEEISGTIPRMIENTMKRLSEAIKELGLPDIAVKEAIINALAHREYSISAPVKVSVFRDRIEIKNPGPLKPPVSLENAKTGIHSLRNPLCYSLLKIMGYAGREWCGIRKLAERTRSSTGHDIRMYMNYDEFAIVLPGINFSEEDTDDGLSVFDWGI